MTNPPADADHLSTVAVLIESFSVEASVFFGGYLKGHQKDTVANSGHGPSPLRKTQRPRPFSGPTLRPRHRCRVHADDAVRRSCRVELVAFC